MRHSGYHKTASRRDKSLQTLEDTSNVFSSCACACAEAALSQKGLLCPAVRGETLKATGKGKNAFSSPQMPATVW